MDINEAVVDQLVSPIPSLLARIAGLEGEVARLSEQIECRDQRKMYVWTDHFSYLAVAHAKSVSKARELLLTNDCIGESGDGSCPERDKARKTVLSMTPCIWLGENAEFALTDSAELKEQEQHSARLKERASKAEAERDTLLAANVALREVLNRVLVAIGVGENAWELGRYGIHIDEAVEIMAALSNPGATEALERVRREAKIETWLEAKLLATQLKHKTSAMAFAHQCECEIAALRGGE